MGRSHSLQHRTPACPHCVAGCRTERQAAPLPREYVKSGIRSRAEDLITKELGHRTIDDAIEAQRREVDQLRFTSLDRVVQRQNPAEADYFIVRCDPAQSTAGSFLGNQKHLAARLSKLEHMELAENLGESLWRVRGDFAAARRMIERTKDRQRVLAAHGALLSDERLPFAVTSFRDITHIQGRAWP